MWTKHTQTAAHSNPRAPAPLPTFLAPCPLPRPQPSPLAPPALPWVSAPSLTSVLPSRLTMAHALGSTARSLHTSDAPSTSPLATTPRRLPGERGRGHCAPTPQPHSGPGSARGLWVYPAGSAKGLWVYQGLCQGVVGVPGVSHRRTEGVAWWASDKPTDATLLQEGRAASRGTSRCWTSHLLVRGGRTAGRGEHQQGQDQGGGAQAGADDHTPGQKGEHRQAGRETTGAGQGRAERRGSVRPWQSSDFFTGAKQGLHRMAARQEGARLAGDARATLLGALEEGLLMYRCKNFSDPAALTLNGHVAASRQRPAGGGGGGPVTVTHGYRANPTRGYPRGYPRGLPLPYRGHTLGAPALDVAAGSPLTGCSGRSWPLKGDWHKPAGAETQSLGVSRSLCVPREECSLSACLHSHIECESARSHRKRVQ